MTKYTQTATHKECRHCRVVKLHSEFSPAKRGACGLAAYCKPCSTEKFKPDPEKVRQRTARYREKHSERWKALHRLHQLKRRSNIEALCDGTLTDGALREIYSRELCFWCGEFVLEVDRTLEHVVELSAGGLHSIHNAEMACRSCNSARKGRSTNATNSN